MTPFEIPLSATPQKLSISLNGQMYNLTIKWNAAMGTWTMDIASSSNSPIISGIPLVTGVDLLEQYAYLELGGSIYAQMDGDLYAPPTLDNLGASAHLYWVQP